jgi:hypothetical protein
MSDPRDDFFKSVNFLQIEVREYPKIAFLCGGNPELISTSNTSEQFSQSVRSCISRLLEISYPTLRYQNAEDVKDWNSYSAYDDLIEFERDIAHICKTIVLFVESPGSIAELGSFAIIPEITEKLIVFVHTDYSESTSFVALGPLKRIADIAKGSNGTKEKIHYIAWVKESTDINGKPKEIVRHESLGHWGKYTCDAINSALNSRLHIDHNSDKYRRTKEALFIHDIVSLFKAITEDEILEYFWASDHDIQEKNLQRSLFCLKKLELVRSINKGSKTYYVSGNPSDNRYLIFKNKVDTLRFSHQLNMYYQHSSHLARREAIHELVRGQG